MLTKEELKETYIRYTPDITEEIFDKIVKKLTDLGYTQINHAGLGLKYSHLISEDRGYICIFNYKSDDFGIDNNDHHYKEIFLSDILGDTSLKQSVSIEKEWWKDLKKGDYVVCTYNESTNNSIPHNYIFQVNNPDTEMYGFVIDREGRKNGYFGYNKERFRLANDNEIALYLFAGEPVDVTTYKIPKEESKTYYGNIISDYIFKELPDGTVPSLSECNFSADSKVKISEYNIQREATAEEKQWLNVCIAENKFIEKEIALRGYDMYGKALKSDKEFVLPEKWCFKATKESEDFQRNEFENKTNVLFTTPYYYWHNPSKDYKDKNWEFDKFVPENYTEITFEQFKKHVLKEEAPVKSEVVESKSEEKSMKAIIIENKEQWDFALNRIREGKNFYEKPNSYKVECLNSVTGEFSNIEYYKRIGYKIITFDQWCKEENIDNPFKSKEMKFEKDKWYKYKHPDGLFYLKCSLSYIGDTIRYAEYISTIDLPTHRVDNHAYSNSYVTDEEVSLEEIQQYLPDGHPDKIKVNNLWDELKVGDYLYIMEGLLEEEPHKQHCVGDIIKITRIGNDEYGKWINHTPSSFSGGGFRWTEKDKGYILDKHFRKATANEIASITSKEEYKVGDWVYLSVVPKLGNSLNIDKSEDGIYQLLEIDESKHPTGHLKEESHFMFKKGMGYYRTNKINAIRKATPEEIYKAGGYPKQKETKYFDDLSQHIGRYIKALVDYPNGGDVRKGEIGKILDKGNANFPSQSHYACSVALAEFNKDRYELLPESYSPEVKSDNMEDLLEEAKRRFPVGTRFKVAHNSSIAEVVSHNKYENTFVNNVGLHINLLSKIIENEEDAIATKGASVYCNGKWAEIISSPKEPVKESSLPTDEELLEYANKHFYEGVKFLSTVSNVDWGQERECILWNKEKSFKWGIDTLNGVRGVICNNGMSGNGCSNPFIYTDDKGWCKITYSPVKEEKTTNHQFKVGDEVFLPKYGTGVFNNGTKEELDWAHQNNIPLNTKLIIDNVNSIGDVRIKGYMYTHPASKFRPISELNKQVVYDPEEWGWRVSTLRAYPLTPDEVVKQDVISPILFKVKEI